MYPTMEVVSRRVINELLVTVADMTLVDLEEARGVLTAAVESQIELL